MKENVSSPKMKCYSDCGSCDYGSYIGKYFDAEVYKEYLQIPNEAGNDKQTKIAEYLFEQLNREKQYTVVKNENTDKKIEILTVGVGPGRIEIPFLRKCIKEGISLKLTTVDIDTGMLREFYTNICKTFNDKIEKSPKPIEANDKKGIHYFKINIIENKNTQIEIEAFCGNLENLHKKKYCMVGGVYKQYDYIFSIFVLHAITNWEEPLYHLIRMLRPRGKIVFAEEIGDVNWLDNHFDDIEKHCDSDKNTLQRLAGNKIIELHRKFWKEYHHARKEGLGKEWTKDTKASDLGTIKVCFDRMEDLGLLKNCSTDKGEYIWAAEKKLTLDQLLKWIKGDEHLYTPLSYGLGSPINGQREKTVKELSNEILNDKWDEWKFRHLRDFHKKLFDDKRISDQDALGIYMEWWLKKELEGNGDIDRHTEIPREEGHRFYIYEKIFAEGEGGKNVSNEKGVDYNNLVHKILYGNTVCLHRLKERTAYEIHQIPGHHRGEVPPHELTHRLYTLRDMYFRLFPFTHTIYTKWKLEDPTDLREGRLENIMPVLLTFPAWFKKHKNNNEDLFKCLEKYLATYVMYIWIVFRKEEKSKDFSFTDFVFREMPEKFPIIIKREKNGEKVSVKFSQVSSGKVKHLEVCVPESLIIRFIGWLLFRYKNGKNIGFDECFNKIISNGHINKFIDNLRCHTLYKQNSSWEYQDSILFQAGQFFKLADEIQNDLCIEKVDIEQLEKDFKKEFKDDVEKVSEAFTGIKIYNSWPDDIPVERFLFSALRTSVIGYNTEEGEWDIFSKYPGKCFDYTLEDKSREEGIGGFIVMRRKIDIFDNKIENERLEKIFEGMLFLISGLWSRNDSILEWGRLTRKQGTKAAATAIMGRNMSHNIGSHVLHYLSQKDKYYSYIQSRVDFIAEIAMSEPLWTVSMGLSKSIMYPLMGVTDDAGANRAQFSHWGNIVRSEFLNSSGEVDEAYCAHKIKIKVINNKENNTYEANNGENVFTCNKSLPCRRAPDEPIMIDIDIPHGQIGIQAFYTLIENIIRNTAKYRTDKESELKITMTIKEPESDSWESRYYEVVVEDNNLIPKGKKEEVYKIIFGNEHEAGALKDPLVKDDGSINKRWLGFKEMRICAGWLRMRRMEEVDGAVNPFEPPLLSVDENELKTKDKIIYKFFVLKPQRVLIVSPCVDMHKKKELKDKGIYVVADISAIEKMIKEKKLAHGFVIFDNFTDEVKNWLKSNHARLPYRILARVYDNDLGCLANKVAPLPEINFLNDGDIGKILSRIYERWLFWMNKNHKLPSIIYKESTGQGDSCTAKKFSLDLDVSSGIPAIKNPKILKTLDRIKHEQNYILFDHRGGLYNELYEYKCHCHYEPYHGGLGTLGVRLKKLLKDNSESPDAHSFLQLIEASIVRMIIVDERIYSDVEKGRRPHPVIAEIDLCGYWKSAGVDIANIIKKENGDIYVKCADGNMEKSLEDFATQIPDYDFFLIHQGLIDDEIGFERFEKTIMPILLKKVRYIVIHSGKGEPEKIPAGAKFIELSNLKRFIIDNPDKHLLVVDMLMKLAFHGRQQ